MKDILKTICLTGIIIIIFILSFVIFSKVKYNVFKMFSRNELALNDPTVLILKSRIEGNKLRKAQLIPSELSDEELITFTLDNLEENDYQTLHVKPVKITCQVNKEIFFTSNGMCNIIVFENSKINEYIDKYFNIQRDISYPKIEYEGYTCKNDGKKYYCLKEDYQQDYVAYSSIKDAYETKDKVVIREYYLNIQLANNQRCLSYFNQGICDSKDASNIHYHIDDEIIKRDGVLYEHTFKRKDNSFYLEESIISDER